MNSINTVFLLGRIGADPQIKTTSGGHSVCELNLATLRRFKDGGAWKEETDWLPVKLWRHNAELANQYLSKGDGVAIEGQLRKESWTTSEGDTRSKIYVHGHRMTFLPKGMRSEVNLPDTPER